MKNLRKKVFQLLNLELGVASRVVDYSLLFLILLNCIAIIMESVAWIEEPYRKEFLAFETFSVLIFTVEIVLRVWSIVENPAYAGGVRGRVRYLFSAGSLIDLAAIMPFYLVAVKFDLRFVRIFRLIRIVRLLKVARYLNALDMISTVVKKRKEHLLITIMLVMFMLIMSSTVIFYIEHPIQPERFSSIPETMWWGVATLTTIGYGDMYPITPLGKVVGAVISILGIGLFALPTGILTSGFAEELSNREKKKEHENDVCIHCGKHPHR